MIIKKLIIRNFRSYYGEKVFEFKKGLNLILGANGDGKSTFYDALDFVLTDNSVEKSTISLGSQVSKKMFRELLPGEVGKVSVCIEMLNNENRDRMIERTFEVYKDTDGMMSIKNHEHIAYGSMAGGVRKRMVNVHQLLQGEAMFPAVIKKYSLFKGENALNIFDDKTTLKNLIDLFSDIKDLEPYKAFLRFSEEASNNAVIAAQKKTKTSNDKVAELQREATKLKTMLEGYEKELADLRATYTDNKSKIDAIEADLATIELVHSIQEAIRMLQEEVERVKRDLDENFSLGLLDNLWILNGFNPILEEFADKMQKLSEQKNQLESIKREEHIRKQAKAEAEAKTIEEMKKKLCELPWYIPDIKTMQSMLEKEKCLVCGTDAKKGSEAYKHIAEHLREALDHISAENNKKEKKYERYEQMFHLKNIDFIHQMSIQLYQYGKNLSEIVNEIEAVQDRNQEIYEIIQQKTDSIDEKQSEMAKIIAQSGSGSDIGNMASNWTNIKHWYKVKEDAGVNISRLAEKTIPSIKEKIKANNDAIKKNISNDSARAFYKINDFFKLLSNALNDAEERTLEEFMATIAEHANHYLKLLNVDDFTGKVYVYRDFRDNAIKVNLVDKDGKLIDNPNTSLSTTMHLSVLFAISELTKDNLNSDYPMILDAPTSSFDAGKDKTFYQVMNARLDKQCIIVTKSFIYKDEEQNVFMVDHKGLDKLLSVKKIPVYRIEKLYGFDKEDQSSIETIVTPLY